MPIFIEHRHTVTQSELCHEFRWEDDPGAGFSFDLASDGKVSADIHVCGAENYYLCLTGAIPVVDLGIHTRTWSYTQPSVIRCEVCSAPVALEGFTNTCKCGRDYNMSGQILAPRSQWGEETGECYSDIISSYDPEEIW